MALLVSIVVKYMMERLYSISCLNLYLNCQLSIDSFISIYVGIPQDISYMEPPGEYQQLLAISDKNACDTVIDTILMAHFLLKFVILKRFLFFLIFNHSFQDLLLVYKGLNLL